MEVNYLITIYEVDRGTEVNCVSTMKRVKRSRVSSQRRFFGFSVHVINIARDEFQSHNMVLTVARGYRDLVTVDVSLVLTLAHVNPSSTWSVSTVRRHLLLSLCNKRKQIRSKQTIMIVHFSWRFGTHSSAEKYSLRTERSSGTVRLTTFILRTILLGFYLIMYRHIQNLSFSHCKFMTSKSGNTHFHDDLTHYCVFDYLNLLN